MRSTTQEVRDRLLDAAERLIYRDGINGTGVDTILAEASVARMSLYNQFGNKDGLVLAALERRDRRWMAWYEARVTALAPAGQGRVPALFEALDEWFRQPDFHGCAFINAAGELADPAHEVRHLAAGHKLALARFVSQVADAAGQGTMTRALVLLIEGAIVTAMIEGRPDAARDARDVAIRLLDIA
jgi:AcrR family transcriptional regulator